MKCSRSLNSRERVATEFLVNCRRTEDLLAHLLARCRFHADRAYDTNRVRDLIESQGAFPNIPPQAHATVEKLLQQSHPQRPLHQAMVHPVPSTFSHSMKPVSDDVLSASNGTRAT
jgi:hypothetical protein